MKKAAAKVENKKDAEQKKTNKAESKQETSKEEKENSAKALRYKKYSVTHVMGPVESMGDQYPYMVQVLEDVELGAETAKVGYMTKLKYDSKEKKNVYTNPKQAYRVKTRRLMHEGDFPMTEVLVENVEGQPGKINTIIFSNTMAKVRDNMKYYNRKDYIFSDDELDEYGNLSAEDDGGDNDENGDDSQDLEDTKPLKKLKVSEDKAAVKQTAKLEKKSSK